MKLIPLDAVMAIIEKRKQRIYPKRTDYTDGQKSVLVNLSLEINSLEVKEVDLDKELDLVEDKYRGFESLSRADVIAVAKHFFELGLSASNPLTWEDIGTIDQLLWDLSIEHSKKHSCNEVYFKEVLKRFIEQKGE